MPKPKKPKVLIVTSRYYAHIAAELEAGAIEALEAAGAKHGIMEVPGALEIPAAISLADSWTDYDGFVALGCVIRGETSHYDIVAGESARALMDLTLAECVIGNGILTVENEAQALARARRSEKNKGADAANAALAMIKIKRTLIPGEA
jgi:6,7-dimethyl-8-ribityllumazine synthase